ncbi:TonB-dependent receptor [Pontibacter cellulosilyticus]|uniref:TonB-dependent receptor n=1 Tax=Pontibacter cellulosilyticus TaxID=1720253 RepID=A0A923SJK1_9BACT|nr:TonB-dependent receptor [Pontibacter cellulosilyticus]MBC5993908.1 TonB-dependent receptor [Pontibacter cellulosilyticus]
MLISIQKLLQYPLLAVMLALAGIYPAVAQPPAATMPDAGGIDQDCGLTISGKILDHDTRSTLVGATVYIPQLNRAAIADEYGNYHFHHLCKGTYTLKVTYIGYETENFVIKLSSSTVRDLQLHTDATTLGTVEITGSHVKEQAQSTETLSGRALEETRGLSLAESLKGIAGVTTIQTGPTISKPVIHGMHSNRVLLLNNGIRQEGQQWGTEHAPEIDPFVASEMKVIKGAAGVRYGSDAIGGVVIVEPSPLPETGGTKGEVNLVGTSNNRQLIGAGTLEGKLNNLPLSWRVQGSYKKAGNARTPDYYLENTGFEEQNFSGALGYKKERFGSELFYSQFNTKLGILKGAHIGNLTDLLYAIERGKPEGADEAEFTYEIGRPYQDVQHQLLKAKAYLLTGEAGKLEFIYGLQRNLRQEFDAHRNTAAPALELNLTTHTTEAIWEHSPIGNFSGSVGASTIYQQNTRKYSDFLPHFTGLTVGAFAIEKWRKDRLQLEAGLRYDYKHLLVKKYEQNRDLQKPEFNFNNVSGTLGALYDVGYHLTFGLSATSAWRAPNTNELFSEGVHHSSAAYEKGNPNLKSEQAYNFEASVDYYGNIRFNGKLSVYHNFIDNYIYLAPLPEPQLTIRGAFPAFRYKQTNATFSGVDLSLEYNLLPKLTLDSKTSIVRARNTVTDDHLINIPPDRFDNSLRYEIGEIGKAGLFKNAYVTLGGVYAAEQTRVPTKGDEDFAPAPDAYFLLQAEAGTTVYFGKQPIEFGITGNNLLNTSYREYLNRFRYYADEMGRLLMLRVKIPLDFSKN